MKTANLNEKSVAELNTDMLSLLKEQFNLRMQQGMGQTPKPHLFGRVRRDIARIKTILRKKEQQA